MLEVKRNFSHIPRTLLQGEKLLKIQLNVVEVCQSIIGEQTPFLRQSCLLLGMLLFYN